MIDCGLDDQNSIPGRDREFSLCQYDQAACEAPPASYPVTTGDSLAGSEAAEA
jgi:hypothetical protein